MYEYHKQILDWLFHVSYVLFGLSLIGIYNKAPEYFNTLNIIIRLYISLFLILYFNPRSKHKFSDFDRKIVFRAGIFLLLTTTITTVVKSYIENKLKLEIYKVKTRVIERNSNKKTLHLDNNNIS